MTDPGPSKHSAAASLLGYLHQVRYALMLLLAGPEEGKLYLERFDDVDFERGEDALELLQVKHHIRQIGELTDTSRDLWKTLGIWMESIAQNRVVIESTTFVLVTTASAQAGSAAVFLSPKGARNIEAALSALEKAALESKNQMNEAVYKKFINLTKEIRHKLISQVYVLDTSSNIATLRQDIEKELRRAARPEHLRAFCDRLEGWWFRRAIAQMMDVASGPILQRELQIQIDEIREQFKLDNLPIDFPRPIAKDENEIPSGDRIFIEQLKLVEIGIERIKIAISDYYRAFEQRSKWIGDELLLSNELESYEEKLIDEWRRLFLIMKTDLVETDEHIMSERGRRLFDVIDTTLRVNIRPQCTEGYVMRGSYHMLANSLRVGWHIKFNERLTSLYEKALKAGQ